MKTVEQVQAEFEQRVSETLRELDLLPDGFKPRVRLRGKVKDIKKTAAFEKNWDPQTDSIRIEFEVAASPKLLAVPSTTSSRRLQVDPEIENSVHASNPLADLIRALDRAESRPGYNFVALKWFRDAALPAAGFSWASSDANRQSLLRSAIDKRLILTSKVDNPKSPQFPVTAIRLNRLMPEVKTILGNDEGNDLDFHPEEIRGESLSATVLRERR
jgi:hypothetical protein